MEPHGAVTRQAATRPAVRRLRGQVPMQEDNLRSPDDIVHRILDRSRG
jgi:hypothetical protein